MIKKRKFSIFLLLCLACISTGYALSSKDIHGNNINLNKLQAKWVIINYWADWCPPCIKEIPELNALQKAYPKQVKLLGINFDRMPTSKQQRFAKRFKINYTLLTRDIGPQLKLPHSRVLPTTYILNNKLKLIETIRGPHTKDEFVDLLNLTS